MGKDPLVLEIINNGAFATLRIMGHQDADFVKIASLDYAQLAVVLGGRGFEVQTDRELREALQLARESNSFSILDVRISPDDVSPALQRLSALFAKKLKG